MQNPRAQTYFFLLSYLESCNIPPTVKRKYQYSSHTTSSNSDDDKKATEDCVQVPQENQGILMNIPRLVLRYIFCASCISKLYSFVV